MAKPQPATRIRTCRACGKQFEYPIKGSTATRFHCEECVIVPEEIRRLAERLLVRIQQLENRLKQAGKNPESKA